MIYRVLSACCIMILLSSCDKSFTKNDFELNVIEKALGKIDNAQSGSIVISNIQGSFVLDSIKNDTLTILYYGFGIGRFTNIDSIQDYSNVQYYADTIGVKMYGNRSLPSKISNIPSHQVKFLTDFVVPKPTNGKILYQIDWDKLQNKGIERIYTISKVAMDKKHKVGLIGFQVYSRDNFELIVKYFKYQSEIEIHDIWSANFKILDYECKFYDNELTNMCLNSIVLK